MNEKIKQRISVYEQELNNLYIERLKANEDLDGDSHLTMLILWYMLSPWILVIYLFSRVTIFKFVMYFVILIATAIYLVKVLEREYPNNPETKKVKLWLILIFGVYPLGTTIEGFRLRKRIKKVWPQEKIRGIERNTQQYENRIAYLNNPNFLDDTYNILLRSNDPGFIIDLLNHEMISRQEYINLNQYYGGTLPKLW